VGLRLNPEYSAAPAELYDPSARRSRLGITATEFAWGLDGLRVSPEAALDGVSGLHIHTLCEAGAQALADTLSAVERRFPSLLARPEITWFNAGGGHHITKPDYDRELLIKTIRAFAARHGVRVILEPGEAAAIHAGVLVARVVDLTCNEIPIAVLDTSATTHMPDTIEMPYRPDVWGAAPAGRLPYTYRLGGQTCLAGDVMGEYSFAQPLRIGDHVVFDDMSHYTMVKTTTFNGVPLPSIATWDSDRTELVVHRRPRYSDFRAPLG
jgi:carboxynorspermidine decarboxylase